MIKPYKYKKYFMVGYKTYQYLCWYFKDIDTTTISLKEKEKYKGVSELPQDIVKEYYNKLKKQFDFSKEWLKTSDKILEIHLRPNDELELRGFRPCETYCYIRKCPRCDRDVIHFDAYKKILKKLDHVCNNCLCDKKIGNKHAVQKKTCMFVTDKPLPPGRYIVDIKKQLIISKESKVW